ncbi:rRNA maturation RNase YbeY [Buchnera aphidicola (Taiwanaphis decaspermi)]
MTQLNLKYRKKNKATNIISFPFNTFDFINNKLLGDIVMCPFIISQEAKKYKKNIVEHWAHITIHGYLHLLGFKHNSFNNRKIMEKLEIKIMKKLGYNNPYF